MRSSPVQSVWKIEISIRRTVKRVKTRRIVSLILFVSLVFIPSTVLADDWYEAERGYYTLVDEDGDELTVMAREIHVEDEYISADNKHYIVTRVDRKARKAYAKF